MRFKKKIPDNTRDLLFGYTIKKREIENKLKELYIKRGYSEVITPTLEYMDVYLVQKDLINDEKLFKLFSKSNKTLLIRPDSTIPIARLCSTRLKNMPLPMRLCYNQNTFIRNDSLYKKLDEVTQSGIELIGASGQKADIEIISIAINALKNLFGDEFKIEINDVGFIKNIIRKIDDDDDREDILTNIEEKNFSIVEQYDEKYKINIKEISSLFGGIEVIEKAYTLTDDVNAIKSLDYLKQIYYALCNLGYGKYIMFDLSAIHQLNYYTGIVFKGYVYGSGKYILTGGRYDELLEKFDMPLDAIGFAVDVDAVCDSLYVEKELKSADVMIYYEKEYEKKAYEYVDEISKDGMICVFCLKDSKEQAIKEAKEKNIQKLIFIDNQISEVNVFE